MIATPTYTGELHHRYVHSLMAAMVYCLYHKVELELNVVSGASLIQYARNQLLREFLNDKSFTHIMWIDADVGFDPRAIMQLLDHEKDVVGGVYPMKCIPLEWPYEPMPGEQTGSLHRAKIMPGGFLLCSRKACEAVAETASTYTHHMNGMQYPTKHVFDVTLEDGVLLGEDVIFSRRLVNAGLDIWCDPDISFQHCGQFQWRGNLRQAIEQGPRAPQFDKSLLPEIESNDHHRILVACEQLFGAWGNAWAVPSAELMTLALLAKKAKRIVEFGSGLSTIVLAAANRDAEVHALEDKPEWVDFMRRAVEEAGLTNVTIHAASTEDRSYTVPEGLPESFDLAFVDGPVSPTDRLPIFERFASHIEGAVVVIDDAHEFEDIVARYRHEVIGERFAVCMPRMVTSTAA